jgi:Ca2+-binding EF-hand superfamily protein
MAATVDVENLASQGNIFEALFKFFDVDGSDKITSDNLLIAFSKTGKETTMEEAEKLISLHGIGSLGREEFRKMLLN